MTQPTKRANRGLLILMVTMMVVVAIGVVTMWAMIAHGPRDPGYHAKVEVGGPFALVDQHGDAVTEKTYAGRFKLVYFGYTFCPDACPTELQVMAQAMDLLGDDAAKVQPIFVTIDPARDTAAQLAAYVPQFDKRLVGLTGTPQQIAAMAKAYKVYYAKAPDSSGDKQSYAMNHSSYVYLMDPDDRFLTVFTSDTDADKMALAIRGYMHGQA